MTRTVLLLMRHGATRANACRPHLLQGLRPDSALIDLGNQQVRAAKRILRHYPIAAFYSSPLQRARQTATGVAGRRVPIIIEEAIVEVDMGRWTGLTWPEVERLWPEAHRAFREDPEHHGYLDGENLAQVRERTLPALERLVARHPGQTFLVVGHGTVNRVLLAHWLGLPVCYARQLPQENTALNVVEFSGTSTWVRTINSINHLAGVMPAMDRTLTESQGTSAS
jgi:broad specificity phosphatase PhoE